MFSAGSYAKVWEVKRVAEKFTDLRISTSKKLEDGKYEQDFGGFVRLVGKAHKDATYINENDSFKIVRCGVVLLRGDGDAVGIRVGVENHYDKEKKQTYTNFIIFEIETDDPKDAPETADDNPFL